MVDILSAVPEEWRDRLRGALRAKPVRTASGVSRARVLEMRFGAHLGWIGGGCCGDVQAASVSACSDDGKHLRVSLSTPLFELDSSSLDAATAPADRTRISNTRRSPTPATRYVPSTSRVLILKPSSSQRRCEPFEHAMTRSNKLAAESTSSSPSATASIKSKSCRSPHHAHHPVSNPLAA